MASLVSVREEQKIPLLQSHRDSITAAEDEEEEILPSSSPFNHHQLPPPPPQAEYHCKPGPTTPNQRLVSLDVFRGLTVALMILVDDAGGAFPSINHSPWFGVTLADFVMPFFLFGVGVSVGLVFKKVPNKTTATKKVIVRTIKLFLLGLVLQGGYFHGRNDLTYGVDIDKIRWLGVLQRISIGYFLAAMSEIWLISNTVVDSSVAFVKKYFAEWIVAILLSSLYIGLLYGLYVPSWEFDIPSNGTQMVHCGVRGSLGPPCNAVGLVDRFFLGERHLYQRPVYKRTKECSVNSPDYGPLPENYPGWCLAPFDPEGILSSLMAAVTCFIGLHYGHIIVDFKSHMQRILLWSMSFLPLLLIGYIMKLLGMPFSKPLYTLSYMCITTGLSGFFFTIIYYMVDVKLVRRPTILLQWMGLNALIVYALAACELFPAAIQGFYWRSPENNLVSVTELLLQTIFHSKRWGTLAFVLLEILFWCLVAGFLHRKGVYLKL
ncbi:heparan-alpha-glucosaminide N-acetyltransferase-like protein isoform X2 [Cinnamomum micranthum f. kanehirae]|uniref:Heparan-alpha-glucosaminide N-acetyltransferase-like protein isoform X2 n=1 Tax=Cinnamomum micranthum f. kanehirae TaxID=337451 RepID=A0A443PU30_9MAGN|nr:heparan-alpha-glucosaminide N-acetyltransferase-like protein isoform X2 [Cinnamomum micranthum f. kanehirae]